MEFELKKDKKLNARDLITIGIFNAIGIVIYMLLTSILCITVFGSLIATAAVFIVNGVVYMLIAIKIQKRGVFLISGILFALMSLASGHVYHLIALIAGAVISELVAGKYNSLKRISAAYVTFTLSDFIGVYLPIFAFGASYLLQRASRFGIRAEAMKASLHYFTGTTFILLLILNIVCAVIGAWIGLKIIDKHFKKSNLIE